MTRASNGCTPRELGQPVAGLNGLARGRLGRDQLELDLARPAADVQTLLSLQGVLLVLVSRRCSSKTLLRATPGQKSTKMMHVLELPRSSCQSR